MSRATNRAIERHYFDQFKAHFPLPPGELEYGDKPDVIIQGERRIGVEIANLYLADGRDPTSEQTQRHFREAVLKHAQALYLAAGGKTIELTVSFDPTHPIANKKSVASALAVAAKSIEKLPVGPVDRIYLDQIPEVWFIYHNPTEYPDAVCVPLRFTQYRVCRFLELPRSSTKNTRSFLPTDHAMRSGCCSSSTSLTLHRIKTLVGPIQSSACPRSSRESSSTSPVCRMDGSPG